MGKKETYKGEKLQKRDYYRLACLLNIKFEKVGEDELDILNGLDREGIVVDISGGGLKFVANENLEIGSIIKICMALNKEVITLDCKVLHKQTILSNVYKYQYRGIYSNITRHEQEKIIFFIFMEQRRKLKG